MARKRKSSSGGGSLDSLLDTMTNVVGILVIVLVVTQLGVGEAVKRIQGIDAPLLELTEQQVEQAQQQSVEVSAKLKQLADATSGINLAAEQLALNQQQNLIAQLEKDLSSLQGKINLEQVRKDLELEKQKEAELEKVVLAAQEEIAKLKAQLETTPEEPGVAPTIVTLPDPRPAPDNAQAAVFLCRDEQVWAVDENRIKGIANNVIQPFTNDKNRIDAEKAIRAFNSQKRSSFGLDLSLKNINETIYLVVTPDGKSGDKADRLATSASTFNRLLRRINPQQFYLRFIVWPDSFETYLTARSVADEFGIQAGWEAYAPTQEYRLYLGRTLAYKPPPSSGPTSPSLPREQID